MGQFYIVQKSYEKKCATKTYNLTLCDIHSNYSVQSMLNDNSYRDNLALTRYLSLRKLIQISIENEKRLILIDIIRKINMCGKYSNEQILNRIQLKYSAS